jgi:hypothetical protein
MAIGSVALEPARRTRRVPSVAPVAGFWNTARGRYPEERSGGEMDAPGAEAGPLDAAVEQKV